MTESIGSDFSNVDLQLLKARDFLMRRESRPGGHQLHSCRKSPFELLHAASKGGHDMGVALTIPSPYCPRPGVHSPG